MMRLDREPPDYAIAYISGCADRLARAAQEHEQNIIDDTAGKFLHQSSAANARRQ